MRAMNTPTPSSGAATSAGGGAFLFSQESPRHRYLWLGPSSGAEHDESVQVNQYAVEHEGRVVLLDPGGVLTFPQVVTALCRVYTLDQVKALFLSHQDPDVSSGIAMWLQVTGARAYVSRHWLRFLPHFGLFDTRRLVPLEDHGGTLSFGDPGDPSARGTSLRVVPAHFMHSPANFNVYDPVSRILFSGDIGTAVLPSDQSGPASFMTEDFASVRPYMTAFHQRYMASRAACRQWAAQVERLEVDILAPQHGVILRGAAVPAFLAWLRDLECGTDRLAQLYEGGAHV